MHTKRLPLVLALILALLLLAPSQTAHAQDPTPAAPAPEQQTTELPTGMVGDLLGLGGVAAFITVLINAGKRIGVIKDGQAPAWSFGLNLIGMAAYLALQQLAPGTDVGQIDQSAGEFAKIGFIILGLVGQLAISRGTNAVLRGTPLISYSHSQQGPTS